MRVTHFAVLPLLALPLAAQTPDSTGDTLRRGEVVYRGVLGGDSATASVARLRQGAVYRVAVVPAVAEVHLSVRTREGGDVAQLTEHPLPEGDSVPGGRGFLVRSAQSALHVVMLTNPGVGATRVEVTVMSFAPGDAEALRGRRELLFADQLSTVGVMLPLDSGVVYRLVTTEAVLVAPRMLSGAPIRIAPLVSSAGGIGTPFMVPTPGEYRFWVESGTSTGIRLYREEADAALIACVRRPSTRGCRGTAAGRRHTGLYLLAAAIPIAAWVFFGQ